MKQIPELQFGKKLQMLVDYCCVVCTPECCGIGAFNLTPLQIASFIYQDPNREVFELELNDCKNQLTLLLESSEQLEPNENGMICTIAGMNQCFSRESLKAFIFRMMRNIDDAPLLFQYSCELEKRDDAGLIR